MLTIVIAAVLIALIFDFLNGMNDAANSIATIVSTKVLSPRWAVIWAAIFNFAAVFIFGVHVANTIGKGIVQPNLINEYFVLAALIGAVTWTYICTHFGMPISVSHALIGGLIGPGLVAGGFDALIGSGILKIAIFIVLSPILGFILGNIFMSLTLLIFRNKTPQKVDSYFRMLQFASSAVFSIGHGSNDAQKTMGIIAILLFSVRDKLDTLNLPEWIYHGNEFYVPNWVIFCAYSAIALGTLLGGWKVVKTLGVGLTDLKPVGGFSAEAAAAATLIGTSLSGIPVSTTHTITGAIMGVGVTRRFSAVRWTVASHIVIAWVLTIPASMFVSGLTYWVIKFFI